MRLIREFSGNRQGGVAMVFAIALIPFMGTVGIAVDYARAGQAKAAIQGALDSTAIAMAKQAPRTTEAALASMGNYYFAALMLKEAELAHSTVDVRKTDKLVTLKVRATMKTSLAGLFGFPEWDIDVKAASAYGTRKIEVALVLDNTGSMASANKIGELKKASHTLITMLSAAAVQPDQIKVAIVPYTTRVNLGTGYRDEPWLTNTPTGTLISDYKVPATRAAWQGCVADRDAPHNRSVTATSIPMPQTLYPMVNCTDGVAAVQPLTNNWSVLRSRIDAMHANGMTNIALGAQWGFEMLSGAAPFTETVGTGDVERFMILLTDGDNTQDRWGVWQQARMDTDTRAMCDAITERGVAEASKVHRIRLYTVLVIAGNENLLKSCATNPSMFKKVNQASELEAVFKQIADDIGTIRLTM